MNSIKVSRQNLLSILAANRSKHAADHANAMNGWRLDMIGVLKKNLDILDRNSCEELAIEPEKPESYVESYDRTIRMMEMSVEDAVELSPEDFSQLVDDNWHWKHNWNLRNTKYLALK